MDGLQFRSFAFTLVALLICMLVHLSTYPCSGLANSEVNVVDAIAIRRNLQAASARLRSERSSTVTHRIEFSFILHYRWKTQTLVDFISNLNDSTNINITLVFNCCIVSKH